MPYRIFTNGIEMAAFIGRSEELKKLDTVYGDAVRTCFINAKPRMGATTLAKRFCERSKSVYVTFRECSPSDAIKSFRNAIENFIGEPIEDKTKDYPSLFRILDLYTREIEPIVVFDGVQYAPDEFAGAMKEFAENTGCMIILIGDGGASRFDINYSDIIDLKELSFKECAQFHPKMEPLDRLKTFMAVGGVPLYHVLMNKNDFASSAERLFLGNYPRLVAECELIMRKSSVPYPMCKAVLCDIANFTGRPVDVANAEGISRQLCDIYIKKLTEEGLIAPMVPLGDSPRKPAYIIKNPLLAFYFLAIHCNPRVEFRNKPDYGDISRYADMFFELRFRDICEDYLRRHFDCSQIGRWWLKDEDTQKTTVVALATIEGKQRAIIADCKFRNGKLDQGALKAFEARAEQVKGVPEKMLVMFSISGFEDKLVKKAKADSVLLVGPSDLI